MKKIVVRTQGLAFLLLVGAGLSFSGFVFAKPHFTRIDNGWMSSDLSSKPKKEGRKREARPLTLRNVKRWNHLMQSFFRTVTDSSSRYQRADQIGKALVLKRDKDGNITDFQPEEKPSHLKEILSLSWQQNKKIYIANYLRFVEQLQNHRSYYKRRGAAPPRKQERCYVP